MIKLRGDLVSKREERIGEENINNQGLRMWICDYRKYNDIDIQFEDGYISKGKEYKVFKRGGINNPNYPFSQIIDRTGEENVNIYGSKMKIIKYKNANNIDVQFEDGYICYNTHYQYFKKGSIVSPYDKTVLNIGCLGEGKYNYTENHKNTNQYKTWFSMLQRCYDNKFQEKHPSYKGCGVCEEWLNFQNFAEWYEKNYYKVDNEQMCLDKDILNKNNKIYSPNTCIFVPQSINKLFTKRQNDRGKYPIGVTCKINNKFSSNCNINGKRKFLGYFDNENYAFEAYKKFKEDYIKEKAEEYKEKIPKRLYEAMYDYIVEIDD